MEWLHWLSWFFGAALLTNALPHVVSGVRGEPFHSPFATPPGRGLSSATVNVLWGFLNLLAGYLLLFRVGDFDWRTGPDAFICGLGILGMGLLCARLFGPLHGGQRQDLS